METDRSYMIPPSDLKTAKGPLENKFSGWFLETAATILFVPFVLFLRFVGGTWLVSNHHLPSLKNNIIVASIFFGGWWLLKVILKQGFYLTGFEKFILPFYLAVLASTIFSDNPSLSAEKAIGIAVYFILAMVMLDIRKKKWLWSGLINSVLVTCFTTAVISLFFIAYALHVYQITAADLILRFPYVLDSLPRMPAIANLHLTISAAYYLMALPLLVYRSVSARRKAARVLYVLSILLFFGIVILMRSRGALIGLLFIFGSLIALFWKDVRKLLTRNTTWSVAVIILVVSILVFSFYYVIDRRGIDFQSNTVVCRLQAWKISIDVIKEHPLLGSGLETFGRRFLAGRDPSICSNILHVTHNDLLQILVNFGVLGFLGLVFFAVMYFRKLSKRFSSYSHYSVVAIAAMVGMGLVTTTVYSANIVFLLLFYLIWAIPQEDIIQIPTRDKLRLASLGGLLMLLLAGLWMIWKIEPFYKARIAVDESNWSQAEIYLEEALKRDPQQDYYSQTLAFVENQEYCASGTNLVGLLSQYQSLSQGRGGLPGYRTELAVLMMDAGQYQSALEQLNEAEELDPSGSIYSCLKGEIYLGQNELLKAEKNLASCLSIRPSWLDTPYWNMLAMDPAVEQSIIIEAETSLRDDHIDIRRRKLGELELYTGKFEEASASLDLYLSTYQQDFEAYRLYALAELGLENNNKALKMAEKAVSISPQCAGCWTVLAEAALASGNLSIANHALVISNYLKPSPLNTLLMADLYRDQGDSEREYKALQGVVDEYKSPNMNSHWLASRWHFSNASSKCLPSGLTYRDYYTPITEAGRRIAGISCSALQEMYKKAISPDRISADYFRDDPAYLHCLQN